MTATVLFDGVCNLCDGAVRFMIEHDRAARLRFAPLQSDAADALLREFGRVAGDAPRSIMLIDDGRLYERSDAALRVAALLDRPWSAARALLAVPKPLRDGIYDLIARSRYRIFGRRSECRIPSAAERARFL
jgi:predicted DCC family thiol-disulfide oxidoreductase YuxK